MNVCSECGMALREPYEYHPYAACLMFRGCTDGDVVRANLNAVRTKASSGIGDTGSGSISVCGCWTFRDLATGEERAEYCEQHRPASTASEVQK